MGNRILCVLLTIVHEKFVIDIKRDESDNKEAICLLHYFNTQKYQLLI